MSWLDYLKKRYIYINIYSFRMIDLYNIGIEVGNYSARQCPVHNSTYQHQKYVLWIVT